jgi:transposase
MRRITFSYNAALGDVLRLFAYKAMSFFEPCQLHIYYRINIFSKEMRLMIHPKMRYTYVGVDSHKDTHTAVLLDCFFEKLGEVTFNNLPSEFGAFLSDADKLKMEGTDLLFGLEDVSTYGRLLTVFLKDNNQAVKHVNALLVARERRNQNITQKTDSGDAECAARVLLSKFSELPDVEPQGNYWILRTLVVRRSFIIRNNTALKNHLHDLLTQHYPNYRNFFDNIDCKTSLLFFTRYPSPSTLKGTTLEELTKFLHKPSNGRIGAAIAQEILDTLQDTGVELQEFRDATVQATIRQLQFNMKELEQLEKDLERLLLRFNCTLTSMTGIDVVTASQLLSCIGDIKKFSTPAKLARYSGVAPVTYASGKKDLKFANQRGNRELNSLLFNLAVRVSMTVGSTNKVINPFFYDYYHRKISEGKTKRQALKCIQRRLVNIIWGMLTNVEEYVNPPMFDVPKVEMVE